MPTFAGEDPVVDFGSAEFADPPLPGWHGENERPARFPTWAAALTAVLVLILVLGLLAVGLILFGGDSKNPDQASAGTVVDAPADEAAAVGAGTSNEPPAAAGSAVVPEVSLFSLGEKTQVVSASIDSDVVLVSRELPGTEGEGCEGFGPRYELATVSTSGAAYAPVGISSGVGFRGVHSGSNVVVVSEGCEGVVNPAVALALLASGDVMVESQLVADDIGYVSYWLPSWSADAARIHVPAIGSDNRPVLLTLDIQGNLLDQEFTEGRVHGEFADGTRVYSTESIVYVGDRSKAIVVADEWHQQLVRMSHDNGLVAVYGGPIIAVADSSGNVVYGDEDPSAQVIAAAWAPDGRLAYTTSVSGLITVVNPLTGAAYTIDPGVGAAKWYGLEFTAGGSALAFSGYDETGREIALGAQFSSTPTGPVAGTPPIVVAVPLPGSDPPATTPVVSYAAEPLRLRGIGAVEFGMTVEEAEVASGGRLVPIDDLSAADGCVFATFENDVVGPRFMVLFEVGEFPSGRIVRADAFDSMQTLSGISIGSTKPDVLAAYGERIVVSPHKYTFAEGGEYLTFVPADAADADFRLVMETVHDPVAGLGYVTAIRAGLLPAVEWVEGCS